MQCLRSAGALQRADAPVLVVIHTQASGVAGGVDHWLAICPPNVEVAGGLVQLGRWQLHQGVAGDQGADNIPFSKLQGDLAHLLGRLVPACLQDPFAEKNGSCSTWFDG